MKRILLAIIGLITCLSFSVNVLGDNSNTNAKLEQSLNDFAQNDKEADFDSASVKGKTITLKVADDYIEAPVRNGGRRSFLHHLYKQVTKIQKQNGTKYSIIIKDDWTGKFAKMNYKVKAGTHFTGMVVKMKPKSVTLQL